MLVETFGSKRAKRVKRAVKLNAVSAKSVTGAAALAGIVTRNVADASRRRGVTSDPEERALMASRRAMLPSFNMDAEMPEEVYDIESVVSKADVAALQGIVASWAAALDASASASALKEALAEEAEAGKAPGASAFVAEQLERLRTERDAATRTQRLPQLAYLQALLALHALPFRMHRGPLSELEAKTNVPEAVLKRALDAYASREGRGARTRYVKTDRLVDKLRLAACVLALAVTDYRCDAAALAKDLNLVPGKLMALFREAGCSTEARRARLKVPLTFPKKKRGRK
jgi:DNA-directed RNA polymerase I subunit RPA49